MAFPLLCSWGGFLQYPHATMSFRELKSNPGHMWLLMRYSFFIYKTILKLGRVGSIGRKLKTSACSLKAECWTWMLTQTVALGMFLHRKKRNSVFNMRIFQIAFILRSAIMFISNTWGEQCYTRPRASPWHLSRCANTAQRQPLPSSGQPARPTRPGQARPPAQRPATPHPPPGCSRRSSRECWAWAGRGWWLTVVQSPSCRHCVAGRGGWLGVAGCGPGPTWPLRWILSSWMSALWGLYCESEYRRLAVSRRGRCPWTAQLAPVCGAGAGGSAPGLGGTILSRGWRLAPPPFSLQSTSDDRTPPLAAELSCVTPSVPPFVSFLWAASALRGRGRAVGAALQPGAVPGLALAWSAGAARVRPWAVGRGLSLAGWASPFKPGEKSMVPSSAALRSACWLQSGGTAQRHGTSCCTVGRRLVFVNIFLAYGTPERLLSVLSVFLGWRLRKYPEQNCADWENCPWTPSCLS